MWKSCEANGGKRMTDAMVTGSMQDRILGASAYAAEGFCAAFADRADAYVASALEMISGMEAAGLVSDADSALASKMATLRARLDGLDALIITLRELQARISLNASAG